MALNVIEINIETLGAGRREKEREKKEERGEKAGEGERGQRARGKENTGVRHLLYIPLTLVLSPAP